MYDNTSVRVEGIIIVSFMFKKKKKLIKFLDKLQMSICYIQGFDEYMNLVLDDASEVHVKSKQVSRVGAFYMILFNNLCKIFILFSCTYLGRILLKGDCISLIQKAD